MIIVHELAEGFRFHASTAAKEMALALPVDRLRGRLANLFVQQGELFTRLLVRFRDRFPPTDFSEAVFSEAPTEAEWGATLDEAIEKFRGDTETALIAGLRVSLQRGGVQAGNEIGMGLRFDLDNPRALEFLSSEMTAERITRITEHTREEVRRILVDAQTERLSWDSTARRLKTRFREFAGRVPAPKALRSRAALIAVTELGNAYEAGKFISSNELQKAGIDLEKRWLTVGDDRVSPGCDENESAGWIPHDDAFPSGHLRPLRFPGCRCSHLTRRAR